MIQLEIFVVLKLLTETTWISGWKSSGKKVIIPRSLCNGMLTFALIDFNPHIPFSFLKYSIKEGLRGGQVWHLTHMLLHNLLKRNISLTYLKIISSVTLNCVMHTSLTLCFMVSPKSLHRKVAQQITNRTRSETWTWKI